MNADAELKIFINELQQLLNEYQQCQDMTIKNTIKEDILFIASAILEYHV
ncbi:hypothetical protein [Robertmurraya massiliosenegalensis]|nr:hypothetical protein [Robertmurraya massiliosenegalensis]